MKKIVSYTCIACITLLTACTTQEILQNTNAVLNNGNQTQQGLSNDDVIKGLREALTVGTNNSSGQASKEDGFFKNDRLFIPFPPDAIKVKEKVEGLPGFKPQVDKFVLTLNRAAEEAVKSAAPVFVNAITSMTISDGMAILKGEDNAATKYLEDKTSKELYTNFKPKVSEAIKKVELTKYWEPLATKYNQLTKLTGGDPVNADLEDYITKRAISGLFILITDEEKKIRKDPMARVNDILKKVFGELDKK
jgi:hypothetical protein